MMALGQPTLLLQALKHRHTSQGGWGSCSPSDSGKAIISRAKVKFFGQKSAAKNEKNVFIKRKNGVHSI